MTTEEACQAKIWLCGHVFVIKITFIESSGCTLLSVLKIFDVPVILLQLNARAENNCEKTCVSSFKQNFFKCPLFQKSPKLKIHGYPEFAIPN